MKIEEFKKFGLMNFIYDHEQLGKTTLEVRHINTGGSEFQLKLLRPGKKHIVFGYMVLTKEESDLLVKHIKSNEYRKKSK